MGLRIRFYDPDDNTPEKPRRTKTSSHQSGFTMDWVRELGWHKNPFSDHELPLADMTDERKEINLFFVKERSLGIIQGSDGMGKTTLLAWLLRILQEQKGIEQHLVDAETNAGPGFIDALASPFKGVFSKATPQNDTALIELINKKKSGRYVLLIDNAEQLTKENIATLHALWSSNASIILATKETLSGLPGDDQLGVVLKKRTAAQYESILEAYIGSAGGSGIKPFTKKVVERMARDTNNTQEFLDLAHETAINVALKHATLEEDVPEETLAAQETDRVEKKRGIASKKPPKKSEQKGAKKRREYDELIESLTEGME